MKLESWYLFILLLKKKPFWKLSFFLVRSATGPVKPLWFLTFTWTFKSLTIFCCVESCTLVISQGGFGWGFGFWIHSPVVCICVCLCVHIWDNEYTWQTKGMRGSALLSFLQSPLCLGKVGGQGGSKEGYGLSWAQCLHIPEAHSATLEARIAVLRNISCYSARCLVL